MFSPTQFAYAANLLILGPVLVSMFIDRGDTPLRAFQGRVQNSDGLRMLVGCLWLSIFLLSIAGLFQPEAFVSILVFQVAYKLFYLIAYIAPHARKHGIKSVPSGLSLSFAAIVVIWPILICMSSSPGR